MKTCTKCGETQPLDCFHKYAQSPDGHKPRCKRCNTAAAVAYQHSNPDRRKAKDAAYRARNRESVRESALRYANSDAGVSKRRQWAQGNQPSVRERIARWINANPERSRNHKREWAQRNKAYAAFKTRTRQARKRNATPAWADDAIIRLMYTTRQYLTEHTGMEWHVDHIVPLQGRNVCGLHVHFNLRVIPATDNRSKSNHFPTN
jgi:hypothetical protein